MYQRQRRHRCSSDGRRFASSRSRLIYYETTSFVSTKTNSMKCFVNWIPQNSHVLLNKTQPCTLIERTPPPWGVFFVEWFPKLEEEEERRGPPEKPPQKLINFGGGSSDQCCGWFFRGVSSSSVFLIREHSKLETPRGGGFLSINSSEK